MLPGSFTRALSSKDMTQMMERIMKAGCSENEIRDFLKTLAKRGETAEEIAAAVNVLRSHVVNLPLDNTEGICDTCGTGGDGKHTINASTLSGIVAASAGVKVIKHGNRAASSKCGSADLLEELGLDLNASPDTVASCFKQTGFGFCFAPKFHPAIEAVAPIRKSLGIRTIFNLIGPLANPASLTYQLVGVSDSNLMYPMAQALVNLGVSRGMVVHGGDGMDEVTITSPTQVIEVSGDKLKSYTIDPSRLGIPQSTLADLQGGEASENAAIAYSVLNGEEIPARDLVAANAGCAIYIAGRAGTITDGVKIALNVLRDKSSKKLLDQVLKLMKA